MSYFVSCGPFFFFFNEYLNLCLSENIPWNLQGKKERQRLGTLKPSLIPADCTYPVSLAA